MNSGLFALPLASLDSPPPLPTQTAYARSRPHPGAFFAGDENSVVSVLASAVKTMPLAYNPIVLYGPRGVGKSCVAHTLAAMHRDGLSASNGIATSGPDLARAVADAADTADTEDLRSSYYNCDWLFIDDLDRLAKKTAAQQFLLTAIDASLRRRTLVLATLRQSPRATPGLLPRLASRLSGGLVVELVPPGVEARRAIARDTAAQANIRLTESDIEQIVRSRGGLADRLFTAGKVRAAVYKRTTAATATTPGNHGEGHPSDPENLRAVCQAATTVVAKHYGVSAGDLRRPTRRKTVAAARALAMHLVRALTGASYAAIGKYFGGRDHTTVLYACRKLSAAIECDAALRSAVDDLAVQITAATEL